MSRSSSRPRPPTTGAPVIAPSTASWSDVYDDADRKQSWYDKTESEQRAPAPLKVPIPQHLLQKAVGNARSMRRASTRPVGRKGRGQFRQPGWRNINLGHAADYGVKAWNLAKHIATLINVEEKVFDVDGSSGTIVTSTPTVANLSNVPQGTDYDDRIGDSILVQNIEFRMHVFGNSATNGNIVRVLLVSDRLQNGVDPVLGDVLQAGTSPLVQPYLEPKSGRFDVLYDELITLPAQSAGLAASGTSTTYTVDRQVAPSLMRKWNKHIKYSASAGADASNFIGGIFLMAVSGDASNGPTIAYTFRLRFTDN